MLTVQAETQFGHRRVLCPGRGATRRGGECAPLNDATGADSAEDVKRQMIALQTRGMAGVGIETNGHAVEVSPLFALDADELKGKLTPGLIVTKPLHLT